MIQAALTILFTLFWADAAYAGPVPAIVAAAQAFASTVLGAAIVQTVVGMGLSALARAVFKPKAQAAAGIIQEVTTEGEDTPQRIILGRIATPGHLNCPPYVYETDNDPGEWLVYVLELMDGKINGVGDIIIEGERCPIVGDPFSVNNASFGVTVSGKYNNKVFIRIHKGSQTAPDQYLRSVFGNHAARPWTADMVLKGISYAVITFKGRTKDKVFSGGFPSVKLEVEGLPILDPRDGITRYSDNPMVQAWNVCRGITLPNGEIWGYKAPATAIISGPAFAAMNACDEQVNIGNGQTERRYKAAIEFGVDEEPSEILQYLLDTCNGDFADVGGEIILSAGPPSPPVYSFTDKDILATEEEDFSPFPGLDQTYNGIHASYPDPAQNWEIKEAVPIYNLPWEVQDGGRRLIAELRLRACPYPRQVRRVMRELIADHRRMRNHTVVLPPDAGQVRVLDTVAWSSWRNRYSNKLFEVRKKDVDPVTQCVILQLRERDPNDYIVNPTSDNIFPPVTPTVPEILPPMAGIMDWDAFAVDAGGKPGIKIVWNKDIDAESISWVVMRATDGVTVTTGSTTDLDLGEAVITAGLKPATGYLVQARAVLYRGGQWTQTIAVTTLDLGLSWLDLVGEVRDDFLSLREWADGTGGYYRDLLDELGIVRDEVIEGQFQAFTEREKIRADIRAVGVTLGDDIKATADAVDVLVARVKDTEDGLEAQADAFTLVEAKTDAGTANGMFRMSAVSGPAGVLARLAMGVSVSGVGGSFAGAGVYMDAVAAGRSNFIVTADRFAVVSGPTGTPDVPFVIEGDTVYINNAKVRTLSIGENEVTVAAFIASPTNDLTLTYVLDGEINETYQVFILAGCTISYTSWLRLYVNGVERWAEAPSGGTLASRGYVANLMPGNHTIRIFSDDSRNINGAHIYVLATKR